MSCDQSVVFLPPGEIAPFSAQVANHLQHVVDLGGSQCGIEGRHRAFAFGYYSSDLTIAFALYRIPKVGRRRRQGGGDRAIATAAWPMAIRTSLGIDQVHSLIAAAAGGEDNQE